MAEAVDPVDDRLDLVGVVLLGRGVVGRPRVVDRVRHAVRLDGLRVDLRTEEVVDAHAVRAGAVERRVDRVLVRPGRAQAGLVDHLEDRVDAQEVPRLDRLAGRGVDRVRDDRRASRRNALRRERVPSFFSAGQHEAVAFLRTLGSGIRLG